MRPAALWHQLQNVGWAEAAKPADRGKPHTSALVACARKLLVFADAVVARGTTWTDRPIAA